MLLSLLGGGSNIVFLCVDTTTAGILRVYSREDTPFDEGEQGFVPNALVNGAGADFCFGGISGKARYAGLAIGT